MKIEINREEFREHITEAFEKANPDSYSKSVIFSEIEDRFEDSTGKRTVMQSMFRVRKVCMTSLVVLIIVAMSGGTYSAVSMFRGANGNYTHPQEQSGSDNKGDNRNSSHNTKNDVKDIDTSKLSHKEIIINCLRENCAENCYYNDTNLTELRDERLADAIEAVDFQPQIKVAGKCEFIYIGLVSGVGISDRVFNKSEKHTFVIMGKKFLDNINKYSAYDAEISVREVGKMYSFVCGEYEYSIYDITEMPIYSDDIGEITAYYWDDMNDYDSFGDCSFDIDTGELFEEENVSEEIEQSLKKTKMYEQYTLDERAFQIFNAYPKIEDYNWKNYNDMFTSKKHMMKEYKKYEQYVNEIVDSEHRYTDITDNLLLFQCEHPEKIKGAGGKLVYNISYQAFARPYFPDGEWKANAIEKYDRKCYYKFQNLEIYPEADKGLTKDDIDSVTITVDNATLCRVRQATLEEEREYEKSGYIGSMINHNKGIGNSDYSVYLDYGDSITIPYEDMDKLDEYGIYLSRPRSNYKEYKEGIDMLYKEKFWQVDYLKDNVKIHIKVNMTGESDVQTIIFDNNYYYDDESYIGKIGYTVCGWE